MKEALTRSADYNIYVRDRKPFVRFTNKAYVLPRTGQRGIPVVSVNTDSVNVRILRIGDRNLMSTVLGRDFQRNLDRYDLEKLSSERGVEVWKGDMKVESALNADVTTAFPVDQAVGELAPGVYVMVAEPTGPKSRRLRVDGDAMVHRLRSRPRGLLGRRWRARVRAIARDDRAEGRHRGAAACAQQRGAGDTHDRRRRHGEIRSRAGARGGRPVARHDRRRRAEGRLRVPQSQGAGVRPLRSRRRRPSGGNRLDAFVYSERGVYRSGETVHLAALLRDRATASPPQACR